jgi:hypothetical protein
MHLNKFDCTTIFVKWRLFGRLNNRRATEWNPANAFKLRDLVSLGEVGGRLHTSLPWPGKINARSPRRGKEQIRSKTSGEVEFRRSDLSVVSGRVGRVWKRLLPQPNMTRRRVELDGGKEVDSCPLNP